MDEQDFLSFGKVALHAGVPFSARDNPPHALQRPRKAANVHLLQPDLFQHLEIVRELDERLGEGHQLDYDGLLTKEGSDRAETCAEVAHVCLDVLPAPVPESVERGAVSVSAVGEPIGGGRLAPPLDLPAVVQDVDANIWWRSQHQSRARPVRR